MKIAIVSDAIYPYHTGGKEKRIYEFSTRLAKNGNDVHIYSMKWWKGDKIIKKDNLTLHAISNYYPLYTKSRRSIFQAVIFASACFKLLFETFDVIEVDHMPFMPLYPVKLVCLIKRKKMIATWNEVWGQNYWRKYLGPLGNIAYIIEKVSVLLPDKIISISNHTTLRLKKEFNIKTPIYTITNGVTISEIENVKAARKKFDVIFAGRLLHHKNVHILIEAIHLVSKNIKDISCIIIGNGPEKRSLEKLIEKLHLTKRIKLINFLPQHKDLYAQMKSSKVFVFPSEREGFGIVVLEANAAGIPVITIHHPDNAASELITKENGLVSENTVKNLAENIIEVLHNSKIYSKDNLLRYAKKFDWNHLVTKVERVYQL